MPSDRQNPTVRVVPISKAAVYREALLELLAHVPSARGMDPASRASMYRAELERRRMRASRALDDAVGLPED